MIAVIQTGGKQYCVAPGQKLFIPRIADASGSTVVLTDILGNTSVSASVVAHLLGEKVVTRKFRNKTRYHRVRGHRQPLTLIQIDSVGETKTKKKAEPAAEAA